MDEVLEVGVAECRPRSFGGGCRGDSRRGRPQVQDCGVRMLFCFDGGPGHFGPVAPIAREAQRSGHDLVVACRSSMVPFVEAAGFAAFGTGPSTTLSHPKRLPLKEVNIAREERDLREHFANRGARRRVASVTALASGWRPDVFVAEEADFGALIAAELLDIPYATVLVLAAGSFIRPEVVADTLDQVRSDHGLRRDPDLAAPGRYLVLSPFPSRLRDPAFPLPDTAHFFRATEARKAPGASPPWTGHLPGAPNVYFTLGTEFNLESGDLFERVIAGLGGLPVNVLVTVGPQIDPAELGPPPSNVSVERYVDQADVLPTSDLVICHGGSGTLSGALTYGLPMVLLAMGADQPANASRCQALGVGVSLDPLRVTPEVIRDRVALVLADPRFRQAARRFQAEIASLPELATSVAKLERLARERQPLRAGLTSG
jgi:UDP:flavonoid glycosyltransferase YjiC (YdhE family)